MNAPVHVRYARGVAGKRKHVSRLSGPALKRAVHVECIRRANEWAGDDTFMNKANLAHLRDHLGETERDRARLAGQALCEELRSVLVRATKHGAKCRAGTFWHRNLGHFQQLLMDMPPPMPDMPRFAARRLLIMEYDRRDRWWWIDRRPTRTELAVLSLLAGNWPDQRREQRGTLRSVAEVIAAEARALDLTAKALGRKLGARTPKAKRTGRRVRAL